ncbi:MAG: Alpha/beta hydrolase fold protein [Candidatus Pacebacteria bacterium GW2011_GWB1_47_8]|nr:MAG: Alpha/beta hydrolase fold protein [Candidatus Pacebacteria bacterium GW2011_GWA1_46_10]KKU84171.1 MAG: Alpha/beta hydrolase fold protein [Candidatus Pacebacteria bacterium GW2011_GWB1_47_8]HCR81057.1 hypothetical protein [Candidatus Paceibacterota bacterium]
MKKSATKPTIVVLHGWTLDPAVTTKWQPFLKLLKKAGFVVKSWPLPGLTIKKDTSLTLEDYVAWLDQKTKNLPPFILLGHSFGGQLAAQFACVYPNRVNRLILIDSSGIIDPAISKILKRSVFKLAAKVGRAVTKSTKLRQLLYTLARETDYYEANEAQRQTMSNLLQRDLTEHLPHITAPTLIIWGQYDAVTPLKLGRVFANRIPQATLKLIAGARHSPIYTHPQQTLKLITEFLKA